MAEVYFLMRGKGQFRVNDQLIDAEQGTGMYFRTGRDALGREQLERCRVVAVCGESARSEAGMTGKSGR
ncbi:MAG: hypothetical protein R2845_04880 [Thermomicrobiales bacterium]